MNAKLYNGQTALDMAKQRGSTNVIPLLEKVGAKY